MITNLHIKNFKCFREVGIDFTSLNVLTGKNGAGKSSVIQCLLLAKQAASATNSDLTVKLNGPFGLELGTVQDVVQHGSSEETIQLTITEQGSETWTCLFRATADVQDDHFLTLADKKHIPSKVFVSDEMCSFTYLCAERFGPRDSLGIQSAPKNNLQVGIRGQYVAELLAAAYKDRRKVRPELVHSLERNSQSANTHVQRQLELWLGDVFGEMRVNADEVPGTNVTFVRVERGPAAFAEPERPTNMGFGVSYSLPIIAAGLLAPQGGLLIVENPEAHLHPAAQSKLAQFLAVVARSGVQVFVETHSDHVLNGIRLAVKFETIPHTHVSVKYFDRGPDNEIVIHEPIIQPDGNVEDWPTGFFDQMSNDLQQLIGF